MEIIYQEEKKGFVIKIVPSDCIESPREWSNLGTMWCEHRRYDLGDEHTMDREDLQEFLKRKDVIYLPIYMYDHSGIGLSTSNTRYPFNCPWDSGQVGVIFVTHEKVKKEMARPLPLKKGQKNPDLAPIKRITNKVRTRVLKNLIAEVEIYSHYLNGNASGYIIEDEKGELVDSCFGFIGYYDEQGGCLDQAREYINNLCKEEGEIKCQ